MMDTVPPNAEGVAVAAEALRAAKVIAYPTETVYGLGVDPFAPEAMGRLYRLKRRDPNKPVLLIVSGLAPLRRLVGDLPPQAAAYADAFWPGPLSLLLPGLPDLPNALLGDQGKVCVRWTSSEIAASLCEAFGGPVVSTSANASGETTARSPGEIDPAGIAVCIDGGTLARSEPSTVFDPETGEIHRAGAVTRAQLDTVEIS